MFEKLVRPFGTTLISRFAERILVPGPHENDSWIPCWPKTDTRGGEPYIYHSPAVNALSGFYLAFPCRAM